VTDSNNDKPGTSLDWEKHGEPAEHARSV